jgi:hypothetical protein
MKTREKHKNIENANKRLEESYLKSKGLLKENKEIGELRDYLKSSCRSWEYDSDNYDDTVSLTNHLQQRFPNLSFDEIFNVAKDWTGYQENFE